MAPNRSPPLEVSCAAQDESRGRGGRGWADYLCELQPRPDQKATGRFEWPDGSSGGAGRGQRDAAKSSGRSVTGCDGRPLDGGRKRSTARSGKTRPTLHTHTLDCCVSAAGRGRAVDTGRRSPQHESSTRTCTATQGHGTRTLGSRRSDPAIGCSRAPQRRHRQQQGKFARWSSTSGTGQHGPIHRLALTNDCKRRNKSSAPSNDFVVALIRPSMERPSAAAGLRRTRSSELMISGRHVMWQVHHPSRQPQY